MGYDGKIWRPDFQADSRLPQWVPGMGGDDTAQNAGSATSSLTDALKARMMGGGAQPHTDAAAPMHAPDAAMAPHQLPAAPMGGEHGMAAPVMGAAAPAAGGGGIGGALGGAAKGIGGAASGAAGAMKSL